MTALQPLPPDWQDWVRLNVARGCTRGSMLPRLIEGGFASDLAAAALDAALQAAVPGAPAAVPTAARPQPRVEGNVVDADGHPVRVALQLERPQIVVYEDLLSADECAALVALAEDRMVPSTVVDDAAGHTVRHAHRRSSGAFFALGEGPTVAAIEARIAALLRWPVVYGEGLQVLRYEVGGEYRAHFDYFDPDKPGSTPHLGVAGQRVGTLVVYLCDVDEGGSTVFPSLGLQVRPQRGAAVYFANVDAQGAIDPATLHAGAPVLRGVKYIVTKWLRERPFHGGPDAG